MSTNDRSELSKKLAPPRQTTEAISEVDEAGEVKLSALKRSNTGTENMAATYKPNRVPNDKKHDKNQKHQLPTGKATHIKGYSKNKYTLFSKKSTLFSANANLLINELQNPITSTERKEVLREELIEIYTAAKEMLEKCLKKKPEDKKEEFSFKKFQKRERQNRTERMIDETLKAIRNYAHTDNYLILPNDAGEETEAVSTDSDTDNIVTQPMNISTHCA